MRPESLKTPMKLYARWSERGKVELSCATRAWEDWQSLTEFEGPSFSPREIPLEDVKVEGVLSLGALTTTERWVSAGFDWVEGVAPYSLRRLIYHPDYRRLLAMLHIAKLAKSLGVASELKPILAMPLGATELTLSEAVVMYRGLITGDTMRVRGKVAANDEGWEPSSANTNESFYTLIDEIRDSDGNVLYQTTMERYPVVDADARGNVFAILRNVVENGTGRRVAGVKTDDGVVWPLAGKTGTSNSYRNATFLGVVPRWDDEGWTLMDSWIVGAYVGYDNNKAMSRRGMRVSGANGALPIWKVGVEGVIADGLVGKPLVDAPVFVPEGFELSVYEEPTSDALSKKRLMPLSALSTFRPHVPPPIEWEPLEVTTSIESVVEGLEEPIDTTSVDDAESGDDDTFDTVKLEDDQPSSEVKEERAALEAALSSLAGKLRGRQEEREDIEGRYGWLRSSSKSKDATEWSSVTRRLAAQQALVFERAQDAFEILYRSKKSDLLSESEEALWSDVSEAFVEEEVRYFAKILSHNENVEDVAEVLESLLELDAFVGPQHPWLVELQAYALGRWEYLESRAGVELESAVEEPVVETSSGEKAVDKGGSFLGGLKQLFKSLGGSDAD